MASEKKLYRAQDSLLGGVCTGIAEYFNIDPVVVQILTVIITLATAGTLIVVYIALWVIIPKKPDAQTPFEVNPHDVRSDTYGQVHYPQSSAQTAHIPVTPTTEKPHGGSGHVPPVPPQSPYEASAAQETPRFTDNPTEEIPVQQARTSSPTQTMPPVESASTAPVPPAAGTSPQYAPPVPKDTGNGGGALWLGIIFLFVGISALAGTFVTGVEWWQFWPILFVISGIGEMVVPGKKGYRIQHFCGGFMQFVFGVAALPFSLGVVSLQSLEHIFTSLWPILLIMCGLFIIGSALKAPAITLFAAVCFAVFCVIGLGWFSDPGPTDLIMLTLPTGHEYVFDLRFWMW